MRYLKSTRGLKVKGLGNSVYRAWIPNYYGIIPPKLEYKHDLDGKLEFLGVKGQLKGISINAGILCLIILLINYFENGFINFQFVLPLIIGAIGFIVILNFLLVGVTKWKVDNQKQRHANNV